jgi:hypothetical protein
MAIFAKVLAHFCGAPRKLEPSIFRQRIEGDTLLIARQSSKFLWQVGPNHSSRSGWVFPAGTLTQVRN